MRAFASIVLALGALLTSGMAWSQQCLTSPLTSTTVTSNFGMRYHPKFQVWRPHNGADLRAPMMTKVVSAHSGTVAHGGWMGGGGGNTVIVKNGSLETRYLHLAKVDVAPGQSLSAGQAIGVSGNSGHASTAPHLHFEVRDEGGAQPRDPRLYLCPKPAEVAGAGPESAGADGSRPPTGSATSVPKAAPAGIPSRAQVVSTQGEAFASDAEWKKQVYEITSVQTAYELIAELHAKRMLAHARIQEAQQRLAIQYSVKFASELDPERQALVTERAAVLQAMGSK